MKPWAEWFYKSKAWRSCRKDYIEKRISIDGGLCEICRERLGYIVHHKIELTPENINNSEITLNQELLQYTCKPCHDEHHKVFVSKAKMKFDNEGQPIPPDKTIK